ncbi:MAG: peptidoglycan synthetase [Flavobacteriales bacterium]|nr:peptidoglycan synthetase [Flavobacteriales bacterium]
MKVHFIAIGGSAMHNLAIALHLKGYEVTGSDDEIFEPSKTRLNKYGLLPAEIGWNDNKISEELDAIILGMHARSDNPELLKAQELGIAIYSYPEYLYQQTKNKIRVVIGGSHGKTSITSMILHVLNYNRIKHDYMVGAQLEGFDCMVSLSEEAKIAVLEGDEYLSSPIDRRPKFHLYQPNIALLSGIAWDHINVFPTFDNYVEQFQIFVDKIEENGSIIFYEGDEYVKMVSLNGRSDVDKIPYNTHPHEIRKGITYLLDNDNEYPILVFGNHNLQNISGALNICLKLGLNKEQFYNAISSFKGASKRLELVTEGSSGLMYKDFAHSPSKLKATTEALKQQFPERKLVACMELHTFSSLNKKFLNQYDGSMSNADEAIVYFNPHTIEHKRLEPISDLEVLNAFNSTNIKVFTDSNELVNHLKKSNWNHSNLLMMSSGNFDGVDFKLLGDELFG